KAQGFICDQQGRTNESLAFYQQALTRRWDSDSVKLAIHVVRQLNALGRSNEAAALLARAEHYAPHHWAVVLYKFRVRDSKDAALSSDGKPAETR
ncbi:MAG: hypothetical protein NTY53_14695, partial [Kiritimatiellaeota bacterium]|nr:hypothetical protein [Kiritimatiellota bacterium]